MRAFLASFMLLLSLVAQAGPIDLAACTDLLDPIARARQVERELDGKLPGHSELREFRIVRLVSANNAIGELFFLMNGPHIMSLENMNVAEPMKQKGLSRLLIAQALLLNPRTRQIRAQLAWTNAEKFFDAQNAQPFRKKLLSPREVNLRALEATPLYKVLSKLGFAKVAKLEVNDSTETITVWLEREF